MAGSVDTPSPAHVATESKNFMGSSPIYSRSSEKRFWSALNSRIDMLLENRKITAEHNLSNSNHSLPAQMIIGDSDRATILKEDSLLLLRGFDSAAFTLSQLSSNLDNALQGARDLAKPPSLAEIFHSNLNNLESEVKESERKKNKEESKKGVKRKFDPNELSEDSPPNEKEKGPKLGMLKRAKNLAVSMATKATSLARELKLIKSDLSFVQERCVLLEEENRRLRDGFAKGMRPEEDDLVRLQLEALLAEKSRLANENANLIRENQCLNQLVEYHQLTSQDLSASYEQIIEGMCLDFSSPPPNTAEEDYQVYHGGDEDGVGDDDNTNIGSLPKTPKKVNFEFSPCIDKNSSHEQP